jgi:hypothetical protein
VAIAQRLNVVAIPGFIPMRLDVPYRSFISGLIRPDWSEPKHQDHKRQKDFISSVTGMSIHVGSNQPARA